MSLMILILALTGLTIASWSIVALVDNLRHDSAARPPRSHRPDQFDPEARWRDAA